MRYLKRSLIFVAGCVLLLLGVVVQASHKSSQQVIDITIDGVKGPAKDNAENRLKVLVQPIRKTSSQTKVKFFYKQAVAQIKKSLEPFGYFHSSVSSALSYNKRHWNMRFVVKPGPRVIVTRVDLQIKGPIVNPKVFQRYRKHFPVKVGKPLNVIQYDKAKRHFLDVANRLGYFQAAIVKNRLQVNTRTNRAAVILHFSTGQRYRFGPTHFNPSPFKESFLRRFMTYKTGDFYNNNKVKKFQMGLTNSPYFNQVIVDPLPNESPPPFTVPVRVHTTAADSQNYTIGGGYGTDTGVRAVASAQWYRVTRTGQQFNISTSLSQRNNFILANYIIPGSSPAKNYYTITGGLSELSLGDTGHARSAKLGLSYNTTIFDWNQDVALTYLVEKYRIKKLPQSVANMVMPSISWTRRKVHGRDIPMSAYMINLTLSGAYKKFLSHTSFFQATFEAKKLFTFFSRTRFIVDGQIGTTFVRQLETMPLSLQLLTGGASSLRGYGYHTIGPGRNLIFGSIEVQEKIYGNFYLAGFYDVGNVSNKFYGKLKQSAGPGLVMITPIGSFEVVMAKPLFDPNNSHWRFQFSMGASI